VRFLSEKLLTRFTRFQGVLLSVVRGVLSLLFLAMIFMASSAVAAEQSDDLIAEGFRLLDADRPGEAIDRFQKVLSGSPDDLDATEGMAWAYDKLGEYALAARYADRRQALAPADSDWRRSRALILFDDLGRREEALNEARELVRLQPKDSKSRILLGRLLAWSGENDEARRVLDGVLVDVPDNADALTTLAEIEQEEHDYDAAAKLLARAVQLKPGDDELRSNLAMTTAQAKRFRAGHLEPSKVVVLIVISCSILLGQASRRLTGRTYLWIFTFTGIVTGVAFTWLYLIPLN
jgi:Flp pilus assembly protein TadD